MRPVQLNHLESGTSSSLSVPCRVAEKHRLVGRLWDHEYLKDTDMAKVKTKMLDLGTAVGCFLVDTAMAA